MNHKILLGFIAFLLIGMAHAEQTFMKKGQVTAQTDDIVMIGIEEYRVDNDTLSYDTWLGELGPIFDLGQEVGFNFVQKVGEKPYITEVWVLKR